MNPNLNLDFEKNHFELFGLAPGFQLDVARLEQAYHDMQAQVHPDKHAHLGDVERRLAMQWATHANEAYQTLRQPLSRARYLLQLHGVAGSEDSNTAMSPAFLMEQMEWREAIMEAKAAQVVDDLESLAGRLRAETQQRQDVLHRLLDVERDYRQAAEQVRELKFMEKLREEINYALEALDA
ncbi:MAG: Fe-S protein assembly co-chaperone HscB [Sulfuricellaceae bacterium]